MSIEGVGCLWQEQYSIIWDVFYLRGRHSLSNTVKVSETIQLCYLIWDWTEKKKKPGL